MKVFVLLVALATLWVAAMAVPLAADEEVIGAVAMPTEGVSAPSDTADSAPQATMVVTAPAPTPEPTAIQVEEIIARKLTAGEITIEERGNTRQLVDRRQKVIVGTGYRPSRGRPWRYRLNPSTVRAWIGAAERRAVRKANAYTDKKVGELRNNDIPAAIQVAKSYTDERTNALDQRISALEAKHAPPSPPQAPASNQSVRRIDWAKMALWAFWALLIVVAVGLIIQRVRRARHWARLSSRAPATPVTPPPAPAPAPPAPASATAAAAAAGGAPAAP